MATEACENTHGTVPRPLLYTQSNYFSNGSNCRKSSVEASRNRVARPIADPGRLLGCKFGANRPPARSTRSDRADSGRGFDSGASRRTRQRVPFPWHVTLCEDGRGCGLSTAMPVLRQLCGGGRGPGVPRVPPASVSADHPPVLPAMRLGGGVVRDGWGTVP